MLRYGSDLKGVTRLPAPAYEQVRLPMYVPRATPPLPRGPQPNLASPERGADAESLTVVERAMPLARLGHGTKLLIVFFREFSVHVKTI